MLLLLALACTAPEDSSKDPTGDPDRTDSGGPDSAPGDSESEDSGPGDSGTAGPGVLVLAGGGTEGDTGDEASWSARLYGALLEGGDVTGDGLLRVAVLATGEETDWLPGYLQWLGADEAFNLPIATRAQAGDATWSDTFSTVDAVFLKGGDQGEYYDAWNDTALEEAIRAVRERGGGIGGTSAGAMSQAEYALAGGNDLVTGDVLMDAHTEYLDDVSDGGSGIHADFLGFLEGTLVDTHFAVRGRLGRLAGAMAEAIDEGAPSDLLGVGLDEQTGMIVRGDAAEIVGVGSVVFLTPGAEPATRDPGAPLAWADLHLDRLTDGWRYDLSDRSATHPDGAVALSPVIPPQEGGEAWAVEGDVRADEEHFARVVERWPAAWTVREGTATPRLEGAFGLMNAFDSGMRGINDEVAFRTLYDHPELLAFLVGEGGEMSRDAGATVVTFGGTEREPMSTLVVDAGGATWGSLSPEVSSADAGDGALHAAGLLGMKLHILYTDGTDGRGFDLSGREPAVP